MIIGVKHYKRTLANIEARMHDLEYLTRFLGVVNAYYAKNTQKQGEAKRLQNVALRGLSRYERYFECLCQNIAEKLNQRGRK